MTKIWGPMGWMTLHSISICYPDEAIQSDKQILEEFMNAFTSTISCPSCQQHFSTMFSDYKQSVPTWNTSKKDLFLAICRMHNTVNKRLNKPTPKNVEECLMFIKNATSYTTLFDFRKNYIEYLQKEWRRQYGYNLSNVQKIRKINEEYWNPKETSISSVTFPEEDVLTYPRQQKLLPMSFKMTGFGFQRRRV
jgi:hypothetical protein